MKRSHKDPARSLRFTPQAV
ncbi:hypothetical protein [Citrobacter amalonaticus]